MTLIIFDFDGTLANTSPGIHLSFGKVCTQMDLLCPDLPSFINKIGPPIEELALSIFPLLTTSQLQEFKRLFRREYDNDGYKYLKWYEDAKLTLLELKYNMSISLGIVTNKPTKPTLKLIDEASLVNCFDFIIGIDYLVVNKLGRLFSSKHEAIEYALSLKKCHSDDVTYIGDTMSDYKASKQSKVKFIAASYGFYDWGIQENLCPMISQISELPTFFCGDLRNG